MYRALALAALCAATLLAQGNYEIQVYGSETVAPKGMMVEIHSNFTVRGQRSVIDGVYPTNHQDHETLEVTTGLNDWSEVGFYVFTSEQDGHGIQWVGSHIRPRVRVPANWNWPVGVSVSTEIGYQRTPYSQDTWSWEIRPIIDKTINRWYLAVNPALERVWHGPGIRGGMGFSPAVKVSYDLTKKVSAGIEYYADYGRLFHFDSLREQQQLFFAAADLNVSPKWELNFGVGYGVTSSTDRLIVKAIIGRRFSWRQPRTNPRTRCWLVLMLTLLAYHFPAMAWRAVSSTGYRVSIRLAVTERDRDARTGSHVRLAQLRDGGSTEFPYQ